MFLFLGIFSLGLVPFQRTWEPLAFGIGSLFVAIPFMVAGAVWRASYNRQSDDGGLTDHLGFPVSRVELATDALGTWLVRLVWPGFLRKSTDET
jgi:hypothetical protein